jgi:outer membrane protein assembly factor BamB
MNPGARSYYLGAVLVALVAGIFCLTVVALLVGNGKRSAQVNPFDGPIMANIKAVEAEHGNTPEVAEQFKPLDIALRAEFAQRQAFDKRGKALLVVGVLVFLAGAETARQMRRRIPLPEGSAPDPLDQLKGGRLALGVAGFVVLGAFVFVVLKSPPDFAHAYSKKLAEVTPPPPDLTVVYKDRIIEKPVPGPPGPPGPTVYVPVGGDSGPFAIQTLSAGEILGTWPGFRGWYGDGTPLGATPPMAWDGAKKTNIKWKAPVALPGTGSPAVWVDKVFLSGADQGKRMVYCFDANSGKQLWASPAKAQGGATPDDLNEDTTAAAPSVATNGKAVFAVFANGDVVAFDFAGKQRWGKSLGKPELAYGYSSSPLVYGGNKLIIQYDTTAGGKLVCFAADEIDQGKDNLGKDKPKMQPGTLMWEVKRDGQGACWGSPIIARSGGKSVVVTSGNPFIVAHDADGGKELWRFEALSGDVAPSPIVAGGMVIAMQDRAKIVALNLADGKKVWEREDPALPDTVSPASNGELLFIVSSSGTITCLDVKTGKTLWEQELGEGAYSSPTIAGDKLYITDRTGVTHIIAVGRTFKKLATCPLGEAVDASPAFVGKRIYIRSKTSLFCIEG